MNEKLKKIIEELENTFRKTSRLFGYHKDFFAGLPNEYELTYYENDPDYPALISRKDYTPSYIV